MNAKFNPRTWHNWIGVALALPILVVAITAVFIAHNQTLGLKDIEVTRMAGWLPGYGDAAMKKMKMEVRASLIAPDGRQWLGTKAGLYHVAQGQARQEQALGSVEVRDIAAAPFGLVVAAKDGIWLQDAAGWSKVRPGDAWSANLLPSGEVSVSLKDKGVLVSGDGRQWQPDGTINTALAAMPPQAMAVRPVTLGNLIMDLHTGKAFFGKKWEWLWIDLIGLVMVFLSLTGVYIWWRSEKRKQDIGAA